MNNAQRARRKVRWFLRGAASVHENGSIRPPRAQRTQRWVVSLSGVGSTLSAASAVSNGWEEELL